MDKEPNFRDLWSMVAQRWRPIARFVVIVTLLCALIAAAVGVAGLMDRERIEKGKAEYSKALERYTGNAADYETAIGKLENQLDERRKDLAESPLLQADPFRVALSKIALYAVSADESAPSRFWQITPAPEGDRKYDGAMDIIATDHTLDVAMMYAGFAQSGELIRLLSENVAGLPDLRYLPDILRVTVDYGNTLTITLIGLEAEKANDALTFIYQYLTDQIDLVTQAAGDHTLTKTLQTTVTAADEQVAARQAEVQKSVETLNKQITDNRKLLNALRASKPTMAKYVPDWRQALRDAALTAFFGFVSSLLVAVMAASSVSLWSKKLWYVFQIRDRHGIRCLGCVSK